MLSMIGLVSVSTGQVVVMVLVMVIVCIAMVRSVLRLLYLTQAKTWLMTTSPGDTMLNVVVMATSPGETMLNGVVMVLVMVIMRTP